MKFKSLIIQIYVTQNIKGWLNIELHIWFIFRFGFFLMDDHSLWNLAKLIERKRLRKGEKRKQGARIEIQANKQPNKGGHKEKEPQITNTPPIAWSKSTKDVTHSIINYSLYMYKTNLKLTRNPSCEG